MKSSPNSASSLSRSMLVNTAGILGSRVFGLLRDIMLAWYWGSTEIMQAAFNTAFAIPNTFRALAAEGAFTAAFVPMISEKLRDGKKDEAWKLACKTLTVQGTLLVAAVIITTIISLIVLCCIPKTDSVGITLTYRTFQILPILAPYAFFICQAGAFAGILNSLKKFGATSLTPIILNIVQIVAVGALAALGFSRQDFSSLVWFCISVLFAGFLQMFMLLQACRKQGFIFKPDFHWCDNEMKTLANKIAPGLIGAGTAQLNILIDKALGVFLGSVAVGALAYSQHIIYLPIGIFGVAMGIVCLPNMARAANDEEMADCLDTALRQVLFMALPCMTLLGALVTPVVTLLFRRGAFDDQAVSECIYALAFYLPGLPAFCCAKVATTTHHGRKDTTTPARISVICVGINFLLNIIFISFLKQGGLALSTSICSWLNVCLLLRIDTKKLPSWNIRHTVFAAFRLLIAACIGGLAAAAVFYALQRWMLLPEQAPDYLEPLIQLVAGGIIGGAVYLIACQLLHQREAIEIFGSLRKRRTH